MKNNNLIKRTIDAKMDKKTQLGFTHRFMPSKNEGREARTKTREQGSN
jgi:hypothetical protein